MLFRREELIKTINNSLAMVRVVCEHESFLHLFNANIASEHFFCEFLSGLFDINLQDLNKVTKNYPALDIGEKNKSKAMAFQITGNVDRDKIQSTLDKCDPSYVTTTGKKLPKSLQKYKHIRFVGIVKKQRTFRTKFQIPSGKKFDPKKDIFDTKSIMELANKATTPKLEELAKIVLRELTVSKGIVNAIPHSDNQAIEIYRRHFDRPFMQDNWRIERSVQRFRHQCEEAICLLNSGFLNSQTVTKPRHDFEDVDSRKILDSIYHDIRSLLGEFQKRTRSFHGNPPEIDLVNDAINFDVEASFDLFDALRQGITDQINKLCMHYGKQEIAGALR